ncbi:MAG: hypothetical protein LUG16_00840 [Candidatus Gastranaerophilales bacterium]|nr:hypothetical protein [Candidatus Gastranaerophilales bacterium]
MDTQYSSGDEFKKAYKSDIENIYKQLQENPQQKIGNSDMSYEDAIEYFDHYIEGVDFSDGISDEDITTRGLRENFAEAFSIIEDSNQNKSNEIFKELFPNTTNYVCNICE